MERLGSDLPVVDADKYCPTGKFHARANERNSKSDDVRNALEAAIVKASALLKGVGYEAHIEEIHHIHKLDAPSGTAKTMAELVEKELGITPEISSVREGEVPGIHTLTLTSDCDVLTFRHEAFSREGLAKGAVVAAIKTEGLKGVHEFSELL